MCRYFFPLHWSYFVQEKTKHLQTFQSNSSTSIMSEAFIQPTYEFGSFPSTNPSQSLPAPLGLQALAWPLRAAPTLQPCLQVQGTAQGLGLVDGQGRRSGTTAAWDAGSQGNSGWIDVDVPKKWGKTFLSWTKTMIEQGDDVVVQCEMSWVIVDDPGILILDRMAWCLFCFLKVYPGAKSFLFFYGWGVGGLEGKDRYVSRLYFAFCFFQCCEVLFILQPIMTSQTTLSMMAILNPRCSLIPRPASWLFESWSQT